MTFGLYNLSATSVSDVPDLVNKMQQHVAADT